MFKSKKLAAFLLAAVLMLCMVASAVSESKQPEVSFTIADMSAIEINTNRYTKPENGSGALGTLTTEGYEMKMENEQLQVWFREECNGIRIVDKRSGYLWGSIEDDDVEGLNDSWSAFANSVCSIVYFNEKNAEKRLSLNDSKVKTKYSWGKDQMECSVTAKKLDLSFHFVMELEKDGVCFRMDEQVTETGENRIKSLYFMPMFGCALENQIDGYLFVPDGSGALMRFQKKQSYISAFEKRIYGADMGIDSLSSPSDLSASRANDYLVEEKQVTLPVFGVVHGAQQNAVMSIVESGAEYCTIMATPAGVSTDYHWITARFDYRQLYAQPSGGDTIGASVPMETQNAMTPCQRFVFLSGENADYSGMAVRYRQELCEQGVLGEERIDSQLPLKMNLIGSEVKEKTLITSADTFTTVEQAKQIISDLRNDGISNVTLVYEGWQKGGLSGHNYGTFSFNGKVGKQKDFAALQAMVLEQGGQFYLQANPVTATEDQVSLMQDACITKSNQYALFERANTNAMYYQRYIMKQNQVKDFLTDAFSKLSAFDLSLDQYGYRLYADYTRGEQITRGEAMQQAQLLMQNYGQCNTALAMPNAYLLAYTDAYFDIPMQNSQYLFETDSVPFLQIVLKGSIDYYTAYANQGVYSQANILKMIEYGAYPSFMVIAEDNYSMKNTPLEDYCSLNFWDWENVIIKTYETVAPALEAVEGANIEQHKALDTGVVCVTYSNGVSIYINYTSQDYTLQNIVIPASGYLVERGAA